MRILVISSMLLFKESRFGGTKRVFALLENLSQTCDLHIVCLDVSGEAAHFKQETVPFKYFLFLRNALRPFPWYQGIFLVASNITPNIRRERPVIQSFLQNLTFDAAILVFPTSLSFIGEPYINTIKSISYIEDDLDLERLKKEMYEPGIKMTYKWFRRFQTLAFYRKQIQGIHSWIAISEQERRIIQSYFPRLPVHIIKYGLNLSEYSLLAPLGNCKSIGFIGNFRHPPNKDAMLFFLSGIAQYCFEQIKGLSLCIAGKDIPNEIRSQASRFGHSVNLLENVSDIADFYRHIAILINPVVSGRGLRTKCIESAAFGRPIISTPLGTEGLEDLDILMANSKEDFCQAIATLIEDQDYYKRITIHNRGIIEARYTAHALSHRVINILRNPYINTHSFPEN